MGDTKTPTTDGLLRASHREYLGDGVYANFDGYFIWLETKRSGGVDRIALEPAVYYALTQYRDRLVRALNGPANAEGVGNAGPVKEIKAPPRIDVRIRRLSDETRRELGLE